MTADTDAPAPPAPSGRPVDPRLLRHARASRPFFLAIALTALLQTGVVLAFSWLLTSAIVGVVEQRSWDEIWPTLGWLAAVVALRAVLVWAREVIAARAAASVQAELRGRLIAAVDRLGSGWLAGQNSARLAVTAGRGLDALEAYFGRYLPQLVQTVLATPIILVVMWWSDWISGLTVLLTLPLIPLFMVLIGLATRSVQRRQWQTLGRLASRFADTVQGLSTLKVFGRQHRAADSIEGVTETYRVETMKVLRISFMSGFALEFLASISVAIVAVSIGFRLLDGAMPLSVGLFVLLLAPEAYLPLRQVGVQFHAAAEGVAATDDVFAVLDAEAAVVGGGDRDGVLPAGPARIAVTDVRVHRGPQTLAPVSLAGSAGDVILLEGPSGSGKSSLFAALRGAAGYDGTLTVNGVDAATLAPSAWLAWAGQQPGLIAGTIAENVALGSPAPIDPERIRRSLELACAGDLDPATVLGVQGAGLSGGQAQRVAVARAFHRFLHGRDSVAGVGAEAEAGVRARSAVGSVIALDEPTSALDAETEARLWRSVRALADEGALVLLISHRRTAREIADRVCAIGAPAQVPASSTAPPSSAPGVTG